MALVSKASELKRIADKLSEKYGEENPHVRDLRQQIATINESRPTTVIGGLMNEPPQPASR